MTGAVQKVVSTYGKVDLVWRAQLETVLFRVTSPELQEACQLVSNGALPCKWLTWVLMELPVKLAVKGAQRVVGAQRSAIG